jgi:ribosome biogenesis GTPase / thiamine phosphate phosphatase
LSDSFAPSLVAHGWNDRCRALFFEADASAVPARVIRVDRDRVIAVAACGVINVVAEPLPAVGDWIGVVRQDESSAVFAVVYRMPPWSQVTRLDPTSYSHAHDTMQVLASNVDIVLLATPLDRRVSANRLEREQVVVWECGALPVVVLTKSDRCADLDAVIDDSSDRMPAVDIVVTCAVDGTGVSELAQLIAPDRTALMLGASGAGKSTLTNALLGDDAMATGGVRLGDARGKHTTTARHLFAVPSGGVLIDSPGIRSLGLATDSTEALDAVFGEIAELAATCRFHDCDHDREPGCAVRDAVEHGSLSAERLTSWRKLQREIAAADRKGDPLAQAAERALWKRRSKAYRSHPKYRHR